ncbi:cytochrome P450 4X1 isoform X2 [Nannospalax galili]|uniref:Cytochrome P450, family 4, subfamily x, polypeptide 1 n=2 Tax=Nannospalax galili TaxID=1026970 RepID=A0A8C6RLI4_NANGA|nr:cytochrome P450 4X1 isoform X2 [Nannospalax galili]
MESSWLETRWARPLHLAFVFCLALGLLQAIKLYLRRQRLLRDLRPFPAPPTHWFLGHQKFLQEDRMEKLDEIVEKYPCAFPCWVGPFQAFFYIYDPDCAKIFLNRTDLKTQYLHKFMTPCLGKGLLNLDGPRWFQHRCLLMPGFHCDSLKTCVEPMAHSVNMMLDKWEKICSAQEATVEVFEHINLMALDIIMKCAFGQETNCQINGTYEPYVKATFELDKIVSSRLYNFWNHHDIIFKFSPNGHRFQELGKVLHQYAEKVIQDRKKFLKARMEQDDTQKYQNLLDIILSAQAENEGSFSEADLQSEVNTIMWAGHDASAASLSWLLYCLALNPEHQDRCRTEIRSILGNGSSITWDQLGEMSYITMCIKEMLRLIPPVPSISRELNKPLTLPDGRSLPAGMTVVLSIWGLHHNPAVWKNPKVFDPLRFTKENSDQRHPCAFLPFSTGSRNCIGQQLAMLELKVAMALILLRFQVAPDLTRPPAFSSHTVLKPKHGIHLHLKKLPEC